MATVLVGSKSGCHIFDEARKRQIELSGRQVWGLTPEPGGGCLAIIDGTEIWRRTADAEWTCVATGSGPILASLLSTGGQIFAGGMAEASLWVLSEGGLEKVPGFDEVAGRNKWIPNGPPLHVRSLTASGDSIIAAVHVGGIPVSRDGGQTFRPTLPIEFDVHEVQNHPSKPLVAAACAVGLCLSFDDGISWQRVGGADVIDSLAVAVLETEVLFSIQEGGAFAKRSQIWRAPLQGDRTVQLVTDGLPPFLKGKIDTGHLAAARGRAAVVDGGGDLWISNQGSSDWRLVAAEIPDAYGVLLI